MMPLRATRFIVCCCVCVACCLSPATFATPVNPPVVGSSVEQAISSEEESGGFNATMIVSTPLPPPATTGCSDCAQKKALQEGTVEYRQARIELIKAQILRKLRMKEPPHVRLSRASLPDIIAESRVLPKDSGERLATGGDEYYGALKSAVVFPENVTADCSGIYPGSCFFFRLSSEISRRTIVNVELWAFKARTASNITNHTLVVSELSVDEDLNYIHKDIVAIESTELKSGWIRFNVTELVIQWSNRRNLIHGIEIACKTCQMTFDDNNNNSSVIGIEPGKQPFLVIRSDPSKMYGRSRRSIDCTSDTTRCCKESFYLSFKEINWDNWIIEPSGYYANYCKGSCLGDPSVNRYHHSNLVQRYLQMKPNATQGLSLCCTPSKMSAITMIYLQDDNIIQKVMPSMVVQACDCA